MTNVAAAPISVRMSRILEAALMYANVSTPEITSTDPIKVSCQSIAIIVSFPVAVIEVGWQLPGPGWTGPRIAGGKSAVLSGFVPAVACLQRGGRGEPRQ